MKADYCEGKVHIIEEGDTLYHLSRRFNVPLALILRANPFTDVYNLQVGDEICIPIELGRPPEQPNCPRCQRDGGRTERPDQMDLDRVPAQLDSSENNIRQEQPNQRNNNVRLKQPNQLDNESSEQSNQPNNNAGTEQSDQAENNTRLGQSNQMGVSQPSQTENTMRMSQPNHSNNMERPIPPIIPNFPSMPEMPNINGFGTNTNRPITLPSFPNLFSYIVEEGESLGDILDNFDVNLEDLLNFNDLDELQLLPGSVVKVPIRRENGRN